MRTPPTIRPPATAIPAAPLHLAARLLPAVLLLLAAAPAGAVDGVLEIHPACVAAGCFPGDGPGFPVEIAAPGSYRLTGNLQVPDEDTTAILLQADDVAVDLNGFAIRGVTSCTLSGGGVTCAPTGDGRGIDGVSRSGVSAQRGAIRGMGSDGIFLGEDARIEGVGVEENGGHGVVVVSGHAHGVAARLNRLSGIQGAASGRLRIEACAAEQNGSTGFSLSGTVIGSTATGNIAEGVFCVLCTVSSSLIASNGDDGIFVLSIATVRGNTIVSNDGFGLSVAVSAGYVENTFQGNNGNAEIQVNPNGNALETGTNVCQQDTTCP